VEEIIPDKHRNTQQYKIYNYQILIYLIKYFQPDTIVSLFIRPLQSKVTPLIRPDIRCTQIVKNCSIVPLKRRHPLLK
jgi:hypothetical protein